MDLNTIITAICSVGFPIVMCLLLFFYLEKQQQKTDETIRDLTMTISNNTKALAELSLLLRGMTK